MTESSIKSTVLKELGADVNSVERVFKKSECPAWGAICKKCHHRNHFAIVCKNSDNKWKKVHAVQKYENDSSSDSRF